MTWLSTSLLCLRFQMQMYWTFYAAATSRSAHMYFQGERRMIAVLFNHFYRPSNFNNPPNASLEHVFVRYPTIILQGQSDILGIAISAAGRVAVTSATHQHPAVFGLFARWLEDNMPLTFAQPFPFTNITFTHGHRPPFQSFCLVIMSV